MRRYVNPRDGFNGQGHRHQLTNTDGIFRVDTIKDIHDRFHATGPGGTKVPHAGGHTP